MLEERQATRVESGISAIAERESREMNGVCQEVRRTDVNGWIEWTMGWGAPRTGRLALTAFHRWHWLTRWFAFVGAAVRERESMREWATRELHV